MAERKRVLLAKMGLDCHDTGIVTVAQMMRENGYEVIYMGLHNYAEEVVNTAIAEDVDLIGVSFLSGQHETQTRDLLAAMAAAGLTVPVMCGGIIPPDDAAELRRMGVADVIEPGTLTPDLMARISAILA